MIIPRAIGVGEQNGQAGRGPRRRPPLLAMLDVGELPCSGLRGEKKWWRCRFLLTRFPTTTLERNRSDVGPVLRRACVPFDERSSAGGFVRRLHRAERSLSLERAARIEV
jgi:hypothetical protein